MEEQSPSADYVKGFNEGYVLAKHDPNLADKLVAIKNDAERHQGFKDGRREFVLEKARSQRPDKKSFDRYLNRHSPDKSRDMDHDR